LSVDGGRIGNDHFRIHTTIGPETNAVWIIGKIQILNGPAARHEMNAAGLFLKDFVSRFLAGPEGPQGDVGIQRAFDKRNFMIGKDFLQEARIQTPFHVVRKF